MKTAVSLPDDVFRAAEREAKRLGISRSELYVRALRRMLDERRADEIKQSYDDAFAEPGEQERALLVRTGRRRLLETEW